MIHNGNLHVLLAGKTDQVQAWAGSLALWEHVQTSTAIQPDNFRRQLETNSIHGALLDAALFPNPPQLIQALSTPSAQAVYVLLPRLKLDQAAIIETRLRGIPAVKGIFHGELPLDAVLKQIAAHARTQGDVPTASVQNGQPDPVVIVVWNGEGGVGKTTVSTNLAVEIAQSGKKVFFANLDAPDDAALVLGLRSEPNIIHWRANPTLETLTTKAQRLPALNNLDVLAGFRDVFEQSEAIESPADQPGSICQLVDQACQHHDVIVLDTPQSPIAAHVLPMADHVVLVAGPGLADARRTAIAYKTMVDRLADAVPADAVHVVINKVQSGHRLDAEAWINAATKSLGREFPPVTAQITNDVRIGDAQDRRQIPALENVAFRGDLLPLVKAVLPDAELEVAKRTKIGPLVVVQ